LTWPERAIWTVRFGMPRHLAGLTELLTNFRRSRVLFFLSTPTKSVAMLFLYFTLIRFSARASSVQRFSSVYKNSNTILKRCPSLCRGRCSAIAVDVGRGRAAREMALSSRGQSVSASEITVGTSSPFWAAFVHAHSFSPWCVWARGGAWSSAWVVYVSVCVCLYFVFLLLLLAASIWTLCLSPKSSTKKTKLVLLFLFPACACFPAWVCVCVWATKRKKEQSNQVI